LPTIPANTGIDPTVIKVLNATPLRAVAPKKQCWNAADPIPINQTTGRLISEKVCFQLPSNFGISTKNASAPNTNRKKPSIADVAPSGAKVTAVPAVPKRIPENKTLVAAEL